MEDVWSIEDGLLVCKGEPLGYPTTKKEYLSSKLKDNEDEPGDWNTYEFFLLKANLTLYKWC